ncbi:uncharacterized protein LOC135208273 [Macrobrachium nipponense]|uniref:uncharacterized protein LOC135208273 n=1 Tax=Macrobrachium nipponense TaxID=159736 RepID=UPI0030C85383
MARLHLLFLVFTTVVMAALATETINAEDNQEALKLADQQGDLSLSDLMDRSRRPGCSNRKCLRWYRGWWAAEPCQGDLRQVAICNKKEKMYCCAHACEAKKTCPTGCTNNASDCEFGVIPGGCRGRQCYCCMPPPPPPPAPGK